MQSAVTSSPQNVAVANEILLEPLPRHAPAAVEFRVFRRHPLPTPRKTTKRNKSVNNFKELQGRKSRSRVCRFVAADRPNRSDRAPPGHRSQALTASPTNKQPCAGPHWSERSHHDRPPPFARSIPQQQRHSISESRSVSRSCRARRCGVGCRCTRTISWLHGDRCDAINDAKIIAAGFGVAVKISALALPPSHPIKRASPLRRQKARGALRRNAGHERRNNMADEFPETDLETPTEDDLD